MHIDARTLENHSEIRGDICIIGAGASGISIALEFINTPYKILLLEGGGFEYEDSIQNLYQGKTSGQKYYPMKSSRLHFFGGASQHWGGMCSPLDDIDFKKREWINQSGWPIIKKDLDPYYLRAGEYLDLPSTSFSLNECTKNYENHIPLLPNNEVVWNKIWQFSPPTRFGTKYKETIVKAKNIHLYTYANAVNIEANENVSKINRITVKNHAGKTHTVKAKKFILACGAIQNSRLLLASNSQLKNGLGNKNDAVGRYFMEHPEINAGELWLSHQQLMDLYIISNKTPRPPRAELALTEKTQNDLRVLNGTASLFPLLNARHSKSNMEQWQDENPIANRAENRVKEKNIWERVTNKLESISENQEKGINQAFKLYIRMEQEPNANSRVYLDKEKDELGVPKANLHWDVGALEKESMRKLLVTLGHQFGIADLGRVKLEEFLVNDQSSAPQYSGGWHHIGTTKMGNSTDQGVVDSNCKVHDLSNLFIAGSGCFPTSGAANPTLTIVALSIRLADYIKEVIPITSL